jgi:sugar phosphate isomerase/epimerase
MRHEFRGLALHTWTLDTTPLATALDAAKQGGFEAVELRRVDFRRCMENGLSETQVLDLVRGCGLPVSALGVEYGWIFATGDESTRLFAVFRQTCENAVTLGCPLVMSALGPGEGTMELAIENVRTAGSLAGEFGLRLAIEFQFQHPIVNSLGILRDIIAQSGGRNVGLLLDAYHLQRGGLPGRGFADVPREEIFYVQYSDVPDAPVMSLPPTDRLPPGKGVVRWSELLRLLAEKDYRGYLSYEAPNPAYWQRSPYAVAKEGADASHHVLAQAFQGDLA